MTASGSWGANDRTISQEDAVCEYKGLIVIERCFQALKETHIKMSSLYHWAHGASKRK